MRIAIGADHGGYQLKARVITELQKLGHEVQNLGVDTGDAADYPDYARKVADAVVSGKAERGIMICGSGVGACVAANKVRGVRAGLCHDTFSARQGVEDDDVNVLCMGQRVIGEELALDVVRAFLKARFSNAERHLRRKNKVIAIETEFAGGTK